MNSQIIEIVDEPEMMCPICLNDDISKLTQLIGCGHSVCGACKEHLTKTNNQFVMNKHFQTLVKCPICRAIEKPTYEQLEEQVTRLSGLLDDRQQLLEELFNIWKAEQRQRPSNPPVIAPVQRHVVAFQRPVEVVHVPVAVQRPANAPPVIVHRRSILNYCQSAGCSRRNRTRDRCINHPNTPCCRSCHRLCDLC